ncbi:MAG: hypothetical protein QXQ02_01725 [Halobacteria archaeon]
MSTVTVRQAFTNALEFVGGYFGPGMLQIAVQPKSDQVSKAVSGRCGYLDNNGQWVAGPPPAKKGPPMFVWRGTDRVEGIRTAVDEGNTVQWKMASTAGTITCFAGTGGFEFQTTEFDTAQTYNNGDALTVNADGKLIPTTAEPFGTTAIVGFCAPFRQAPENFAFNPNNPLMPTMSPKGQNFNLRTVLNFYTCFYAARSA